jgi:hypothetical protein
VGVPEIVIVVVVVFVVGIAGVLFFGGWATVTVVRLMSRLLFGGGANRSPAAPPEGVRCANPGCRADNPRAARFCRRCGRGLHAAAPGVARKVAAW